MHRDGDDKDENKRESDILMHCDGIYTQEWDFMGSMDIGNDRGMKEELLPILKISHPLSVLAEKLL